MICDMGSILRKYKGLLIFMLVYWAICLLMQISDFRFSYIMIAWNTLLATLPLFFIHLSLLQNKRNKRIGAVLFGILWLIFFPNSVYMITDFIHISSDQLMWYKEVSRYSNKMMYSNDIMQWIKLFVIGIGVVYGLLIGMESLYIFYRFLKRKLPQGISGLILVGVSLISGFAVYIGRFLRFNSWDLIRPLSLLREVFTNINRFTFEFTLAFAGFILILFLFYVLLCKNVVRDCKLDNLDDKSKGK